MAGKRHKSSFDGRIGGSGSSNKLIVAPKRHKPIDGDGVLDCWITHSGSAGVTEKAQALLEMKQKGTSLVSTVESAAAGVQAN